MNKYLKALGHEIKEVPVNNVPIIKKDSFTNDLSIVWKNLSGNNFYDEVLNGTLNMVSTFPSISRLFLTVNHIDGKDYLILRHPKKDFILELGDVFYILLENNEVMDFKIAKESFYFYNSSEGNLKKIYENRILLFEEDLIKLSNNTIKNWRILLSGKRKIDGMKAYGSRHNYKDENKLKVALNELFSEYYTIISNIEGYVPLRKLEDIKDDVCYLYLMKDTTNLFYKIGISNNPKYRERTLQSEKPTIELLFSKKFPSRNTAVAFEKSLHFAYKNKRLRGEWFELDSTDLNEIKNILI